MNACYREGIKGVSQCKFLQVSVGVTNTNQQTERECYTCRKGVFSITRDLNKMPRLCGSRVLQPLTRKRSDEGKRSLQEA